MKLLMCLDCGDIFSLNMNLKTCSCGKTKGRYVDSLNAEIEGNCKAIGFANNSFLKAYHMQKIEYIAQKGKPSCCSGGEFTAFFIPESATSVKRVVNGF